MHIYLHVRLVSWTENLALIFSPCFFQIAFDVQETWRRYKTTFTHACDSH